MVEKIKKFLIDVVLENVCKAVYYSYGVLNGRFGKYVLRKPYKRIWSIILWTLFIYLFTIKIIFPIMECWQSVVDNANYFIWG